MKNENETIDIVAAIFTGIAAVAMIIFGVILPFFFLGILACWSLFLCAFTFNLTKSIPLTSFIMIVFAISTSYLVSFIRKKFNVRES